MDVAGDGFGAAVWRAAAPVLVVHGGAGRIVPEELDVPRAAAAGVGSGGA